MIKLDTVLDTIINSHKIIEGEFDVESNNHMISVIAQDDYELITCTIFVTYFMADISISDIKFYKKIKGLADLDEITRGTVLSILPQHQIYDRFRMNIETEAAALLEDSTEYDKWVTAFTGELDSKGLTFTTTFTVVLHTKPDTFDYTDLEVLTEELPILDYNHGDLLFDHKTQQTFIFDKINNKLTLVNHHYPRLQSSLSSRPYCGQPVEKLIPILTDDSRYFYSLGNEFNNDPRYHITKENHQHFKMQYLGLGEEKTEAEGDIISTYQGGANKQKVIEEDFLGMKIIFWVIVTSTIGLFIKVVAF